MPWSCFTFFVIRDSYSQCSHVGIHCQACFFSHETSRTTETAADFESDEEYFFECDNKESDSEG